jgi:hypothetical protein
MKKIEHGTVKPPIHPSGKVVMESSPVVFEGEMRFESGYPLIIMKKAQQMGYSLVANEPPTESIVS